ncbi:hypothetical protein [Pontibacter akesuensis]|nr:hypothetical protein [Pontibacter akesuensis]
MNLPQESGNAGGAGYVESIGMAKGMLVAKYSHSCPACPIGT